MIFSLFNNLIWKLIVNMSNISGKITIENTIIGYWSI